MAGALISSDMHQKHYAGTYALHFEPHGRQRLVGMCQRLQYQSQKGNLGCDQLAIIHRHGFALTLPANRSERYFVSSSAFVILLVMMKGK